MIDENETDFMKSLSKYAHHILEGQKDGNFSIHIRMLKIKDKIIFEEFPYVTEVHLEEVENLGEDLF
jgi:hypothetical protein